LRTLPSLWGDGGMGAPVTADMFLFEGFRLDRRGLFRRDESGVFVPAAIGSRALDVLGILVERPGNLVPRDEMMAAVWPGTVVENSNLPVQIAALRRVLDDGRADGSCIQTVAGRGYRFTASVTRVDPASAAASARRSANGSGAPNGENGQLRGPEALSQADDIQPTAAAQRPDRLRVGTIRTVGLALALTLVAVAAGWIWHSPWLPGSPSAPRLSIVVLPFTNLSDDPKQQYFVDGITEDLTTDLLTTDLSRIAHISVVSRDTAFTYRDKPVSAKQIGRELGVRYVLEGSVRRSGNEVRINAQLIDAGTDTQLWAERFDRDIGDLFALQNEITGRIAVALNEELIAAEASRPKEHPDALDYILRGRAVRDKPASREVYAEAIGLFEHALALDPGSVEAQRLLANALASRVLDGMSDSAAADIARAEGLVGRALAALPGSSYAHYVKGIVLRAENRCDEAIPEYETVLASHPNAVDALAGIAYCKFFTGSIEEAVPLLQQAIRLSPHHHRTDVWYFQIGRVHLVQSHIDEAILWLEKARSANPAHPAIRAYLASAYALKGETERAAAELSEAWKLAPDDRYSNLARLRAVGYWGVPKVRALFEATYFVGLRKAGMPE
jgi:adenylate cyclase